MNQYIYIVRPTRAAMIDEGPTAEESAVVERHAAYVAGLVEKGSALLAGRTLTDGDQAFGIVIVRAESDEAAAKMMNADPAVAEEVMTAEIFPYRVAFLGGETSGWLGEGGPPDPLRAHLDKLLTGEGAHEPFDTIVREFPFHLAGGCSGW